MKPNGSPLRRASLVEHARDFATAMRLLTALPGAACAPASVGFARATLFFPVVGLLLGGLLWAFQSLLLGLAPRFLQTLAILLLWEAARRAQGTFAIARAVCGTDASPSLHRALLAAGLVVKAAVIHACGRALPFALLFAPVLSFWSMVVLATGARDASSPGRKFNVGITFREFALTSTFTLAVVLLFADALGLVVAVPIAALTIVVRLLQHRYASGLSWNSLQAWGQGIELAVLGLLALL